MGCSYTNYLTGIILENTFKTFKILILWIFLVHKINDNSIKINYCHNNKKSESKDKRKWSTFILLFLNYLTGKNKENGKEIVKSWITYCNDMWRCLSWHFVSRTGTMSLTRTVSPLVKLLCKYLNDSYCKGHYPSLKNIKPPLKKYNSVMLYT